MLEEKSDLFRCFLCKRYRPMEEAVMTKIQDLILPKDVCKTCLENVDKENKTTLIGLSKEDKK